MEDEEQPEIEPVHEKAADGAISQIQGTELGVPEIPYYLVEKHQNKTTKLLSNSGEKTKIQAKNRWHDFDFVSSLFIGFIDIVGSDFSPSDEYLFEVKLEGGEKRKFEARPKDGAIRVDINEFCKSVSFKPPSVFWAIFSRNPEIQKVSIYGFYKENLGEFLYKISRTTAIKNAAIDEINSARNSTNESLSKLAQKEIDLANIDKQISEAQEHINSLNSSIAEKSSIDSEVSAKLDRSNESLNATIASIDERKEELITVTKQRENKKIDVDIAKNELQKLRGDINLFPSEISGFVSQASKDVRLYTIFISCMAIVIIGLFMWVLTGAFDLSEYVKENPTVNVWHLLLAKLPLAMVVSGLVAASYKIARVFIEEMLKINRQKLSLTQVSIIAKDVSHAAESELDLTESEIYGLRLRTKMAMLADHIKTFIPSGPVELLPQSIFSSFGRSRRSAETKSEGGNDSGQPVGDATDSGDMPENL